MSLLEGCSILLVEDEYLIAADAEQMLQELGVAQIELVGHFDEAQARAGAGCYDVAILDVNLNGKHSFPIAKILQERGIPFVFATGYSLNFRPLPGFENGICVTKPYSIERLRQGLLTALHSKASAQAPASQSAAPIAT